ncbi:ParB/RepB/Spo0J family partition protein [Azospirillum soli]|uniref:ParB/RepB/Spo0J family partition protein n=1 Tax=Azospirillum soli TaxID=1304799 RepID=UPI001AE2076C|nr:ParB/RepB/Spo0J family partition protein [Azospirillum soli]MBP2315669.1 ParB family chromosome partitioning protein [Azospirillum soli]
MSTIMPTITPATILALDIDRITPLPDHPRRRFDPTTIDALALSIEQHGLLQPILVSALGAGRYGLLTGARRLEAHRFLGRRAIPAMLVEEPDAGRAGELSLAENMQREGLDALELAEALRRLAEEDGYGRDDLARLIGRSRTVVGDILSLNGLPERIKAEYPAVRRAVSRSVLVEVARTRDPEAQAALWDAAKAGTLTVREARRRRLRAAAAAPVTLPRVLMAARRCVRQFERMETAPRDAVPLSTTDRETLHTLRRRIDALLANAGDRPGQTVRDEGCPPTSVLDHHHRQLTGVNPASC